MEQLRVLQVVEELGMGGIQSFIMNVYRNMDRNALQFDFLLSCNKVGEFEEEIQSLGGKIYRVTPRRNSIIRNRKDIENFFLEHRYYQCVHCHLSNLSNITPLLVSFKYKIPVRIIHSHSTHLPANPLHKVLHYFNKKRIDQYATHFFACSDLAGKWLFEGTKGYKNQFIINNGIKTNRYIFDAEVRQKYRKDLGLTDEIVIGNVGRLCEPKNHIFILEVFNEILKLNTNTRLLLVGDGPEKENINKKIEQLGIGKYVLKLGMRKDIPQLLQVFDCFLMPSKWEGFPVALIEAEAAGLPAFVSNSVTMQAKVNPNVMYLDLNEGSEIWAKKIVNGLINSNRLLDAEQIIKAGYDIQETVEQLKRIYLN